jgi:hypothetical protein
MADRFPGQVGRGPPVTVGAVGEIAAAMGWSVPYTLGVLAPWKMAPVYCRAVLAHDHRIALDGTPTEPVDAKAKDSATKRLAHLAARHAAKQAVHQGETAACSANRDAGVARLGARRAIAPARVERLQSSVAPATF